MILLVDISNEYSGILDVDAEDPRLLGFYSNAASNPLGLLENQYLAVSSDVSPERYGR